MTAKIAAICDFIPTIYSFIVVFLQVIEGKKQIFFFFSK